MFVALTPDQVFATPRTQFTPDIDGILARIPDSATTKGMFFNRCLALASARADEDELLHAAGLEPQRFVPFTDYSWADFLRLNVAAANILYDGRTAVGMREIGRAMYGEFADSLPGRMTFGVLRTNADRVIGLGPKAWNMSGVPGQVVGESIGDCHYRHHFLDYPAEVAETLAIGVLESALHSCNEVARLTYARADFMNSVIDIRWG